VYVYMLCCVIRCTDLTDLAGGILRRGLRTRDDGMDGMWSILYATYIVHTVMQSICSGACMCGGGGGGGGYLAARECARRQMSHAVTSTYRILRL
jgi:hypothetical protein